MLKPQINVTPLIDVLLVLLIIFMVVTPMKPSSFIAKIPHVRENDSQAVVNPHTLIVTIDRESILGLNAETGLGSVDDPQKLIDRLRNVFDLRRTNEVVSVDDNSKTLTMVFIKAPRGLDYGSVAKIVDAVKLSGADPVALQIDELN